MATTFPDSIQTFPTMIDIDSVDATLVAQYQNAIQSGDFASAAQILRSIPNYNKKIINADLLNTINDTLVAVQQFYADRYNPSYIVSENQPSGQSSGDYWFQIIEEIT